MASDQLAAEITVEVIAPRPATQVDHLNLVAIPIEPDLGGSVGGTAIGSGNSHAEFAVAVGTVNHSVERNPKVPAAAQ
jgi:hypothetical protein